jgi:ABC-2 type transport system ATP-binding protein
MDKSDDGGDPSLAIETVEVSKSYGSLKAVDGVSLRVKRGEIYGFLGLNGAGKTTAIRLLLGMIRPAAGSVRLLGRTVRPGRPGPWDEVGYLVELPYAYPELTVRENLGAVARLRGLAGAARVKAVGRAVERLRLGAYADVKARHLSLGNNQRLGLAKALLHRPALLILDEPANGLDPAGIVEIRAALRAAARDDGVTVFVSSHNLDEVARTADRIGIIRSGRLVRELDAARLDAELDRRLEVDCRDRPAAAARLAAAGYRVESAAAAASAAADCLVLADPRASDRPEEVAALLAAAGLPPRRLVVVKEDLESYFLRVIGEASA